MPQIDEIPAENNAHTNANNACVTFHPSFSSSSYYYFHLAVKFKLVPRPNSIIKVNDAVSVSQLALSQINLNLTRTIFVRAHLDKSIEIVPQAITVREVQVKIYDNYDISTIMMRKGKGKGKRKNETLSSTPCHQHQHLPAPFPL